MATSAAPAPKPRRTFHIQLDSSSPAEINFKQLVIESRVDQRLPHPVPDSFIDDAELQQNIEDVRGQTRVKTKHSGFFVNAGDEIETLEKEEDECWTGRAREARRERWMGHYDPFWRRCLMQPVTGSQMQKSGRDSADPKVFPRSLDEPLRAVDKLVVEAHPNKWRVTGYFATLMTFLHTRSTRNEREKLDSALETLTQLIATYGTRATTEPIDAVKTDIAKDKELEQSCIHYWSFKTSGSPKKRLRQMLKTEDKKHMKEPDYKPLNQRQERNRMLNRILALFTPGLTDLQTLRALNKAAKVKTSKKPAQPKLPVKGSTAAAKKKIPEPTTAGTAPVKRSIKPFKSRMMDEAPLFVEDDFEEVEQ
ncbi:Hpc2-related domain [Phytophthora cactorum]|nr:Hpc2-related domain [Phytophthora cactorum]